MAPTYKIYKAKCKDGKTRVFADTPYHPEFVQGAQKLNGKFQRGSKEWAFTCKEEYVKNLSYEVYGTDGTETDLVDIEVKLPRGYNDSKGLYVCGRQVAFVYGRDSGAFLGEGIVVHNGNFNSRGSVKYPCVEAEDDTIVEITDVPRKKVQEHLEDESYKNFIDVKIIESTDKRAKYEALVAEATRIRDRLVQIDQELIELGFDPND